MSSKRFCFSAAVAVFLFLGSLAAHCAVIDVDDANVWTETGPLFGGSVSGTDRAYYPSVLKVGTLYHIWYGDGANTRHATSTNADFSGYTFPAPAITGLVDNSYHPRVLYNAAGWIIGDNADTSKVFLMYQSSNGFPVGDSIHAYVSADGDAWTPINGGSHIAGVTMGGACVNPTGTANQYMFEVVYDGPGQWKGYLLSGTVTYLNYFTSADGINWSCGAGNLMSTGFQAWENSWRPAVHRVLKAGNSYVMFYSGGTNSNGGAGMAVSSNGSTFTRSDINPVFSTNTLPVAPIADWRSVRTYTPDVMYDPEANLYRMYFTGVDGSGNYRIGMATSPGLFSRIQDGINAASNGDTVQVAPGTYSISTAITVNKSITLRGATYLTNKKNYSTPALYAWDPNTESIIQATNDVDAITLSSGIDDITIEGFVVQGQNRSAAGARNLIAFVQGGAYNNVIIRNNVIGPNTNTASQDGNKGRMGIVLPGPNCNSAITNSSISGNLLFDLLGDSSGVLFVCVYSPTYHAGNVCSVSFSGTAIDGNEFRNINRTAIELVGNCTDLTVSNNYIHNIGAQPTTTAPNMGTPPNDYTGTQYDWQKFGNGILVIRGASDVPNADAVAPSNLTIASNTIQDNEKNGIYIDAAAVSNINIATNTISNNGTKGAPYLTWDGIRLDLNGDYHMNRSVCKPYPGTCQNLGLTGAISVSGNAITGNGSKALNVTAAPTNGFVMDADSNWLGTSDRTAVLALLNGAVSGEPYYIDAGMTSLGGAGGAPPAVTDNQSGDDTWRGTDPGAVYNVDFTDASASGLNNAQYTVWSGAGMTGAQTIGWTDIATAINASSYSTDWSVAFGTLSEGTNYVSTRVYDNAGNVSLTATDAFYIKKDTTGPSVVTAMQDGTGTVDISYTNSSTEIGAKWTAATDAESGIARYWYAIGTTAGGTDVLTWTDNGTAVTVTRPGLSLTAGQAYYFSVKAENGGGLQSAAVNSSGQIVVAQSLCGDIDGDGAVMSNDALLLKRHIDGTLAPALNMQQLAAADMAERGVGSADGSIDMADLLLLAQAAIEQNGLTPAGLSCPANP